LGLLSISTLKHLQTEQSKAVNILEPL